MKNDVKVIKCGKMIDGSVRNPIKKVFVVIEGTNQIYWRRIYKMRCPKGQ
jgi:hypothetical protein